jgi:hypothetical protein
MALKILISTAYLPPIDYISIINGAEEVLVETQESYLKQSYRNRCYILTASGPQLLSVPVYNRSVNKTLIKDIRIDYSKRWQQVHTRAIRSSYGSSPYFQYYFEEFERSINRSYEFLFDLNMDLLHLVSKLIRLNIKIGLTEVFAPPESTTGDYRYSIKPSRSGNYEAREYVQVFRQENGFVPGLSIIDLIFNKGPDSSEFL